VKELLDSQKGEEIPEEYWELSRILFRFENLENVIFLIIIALMALKPF
jgi:hypothetical protein